MNPHLLLRLYPPGWRRRYEEEVAALLEQQRLSPMVCLDIALGALDARLRPQTTTAGGECTARTTRALPRVLAGGLLLAAVCSPAVVTNRAGPDPIDLAARRGTLAKLGSAYVVDGQEVGVGPPWYVARAPASADYDGDGTAESVAAELEGLVGTTVTIGVEDEPGGEASVYTINGRLYRSTDGGRPPWAGGPHADRPQG